MTTLSGIIGRENLDLRAESAGQINFEVGASSYQVQRWNEVA
ncbi:Uncharacterised protein [Nocardia asteroides]|nr:hypothetical protein SAMN05444423_11613 [Nocardia asteroides]VEG36361.1 Uncharacterised protein [Nocardia asteroides]